MPRPSPARSARRVLVVLLATAMLATLAPVTTGAATTGFRFDGRGWGHGIGMSQYGALGMAREGTGYQGILTHFYQGTAVRERAVDDEVVVGIQQNVTRTRLISHGGTTPLQFGGQTFQARDDETWTLRVGGDQQCQLYGPSTPQPTPSPTETTSPSETATDDPSDAPSPPAGDCTLVANPPNGVYLEMVDRGMSYERGRVLTTPVTNDRGGFAGRFHVSVALPMHHYLFGLAEVPYSWPQQALRAQIVAARSYVTHRILGLGGATREVCACHVYDSVFDQVYRGRRHLEASWSRWREEVLFTRDQVVVAPGEPGTVQDVVQAFYSSSSGGRTESIHEVWGGEPRSYLTSVPDPWSRDPNLNPYATWTTELAPGKVADAVGLDDVVSIRVTGRNTSGSAATVEFTGTKDGQSQVVTLAGTTVRSRLGLRSNHITRIFLPPFTDDDGSPFEADIAWVADQGITEGCDAAGDRYCPTRDVTRGQMAAFLARALELTATSDVSFDDVPDDHPFAEAIDKIHTAGITDGCGDGSRFCPGKAIPRDQMAAFLAAGLGLTATSEDGEFADVPDDHFFAEQINQVATANITRGCNEAGTKFCPRADVTRGQMAAFLARALRDGA